MRLPETIERLYLDFDGFFASVEQQADKRLRGRPVGIVPFTNTEELASSLAHGWRPQDLPGPLSLIFVGNW